MKSVTSTQNNAQKYFFANMKFFLSSTSIVFFYCWLFFIAYAIIDQNNHSQALAYQVLNNIINNLNHHLLSFITFFIIFLLSIISIDILNKNQIKISKFFLSLIVLILVFRRLLFIHFSNTSPMSHDLASGFFVGSVFYTPSMIALIPFFVLYFRNNIVARNRKNIIKGLVLIVLLFVIEYVVRVEFISHNWFIDLVSSFTNFGSYFFAFLIYVLIRHKVLIEWFLTHPSLLQVINAIATLFGVLIFLMFLVFA